VDGMLGTLDIGQFTLPELSQGTCILQVTHCAQYLSCASSTPDNDSEC
jgi:hypothetical protein